MYNFIDPICKQLDKIFGVAPIFEMVHIVPSLMWWLFQYSTMIPEQVPRTSEPMCGASFQ